MGDWLQFIIPLALAVLYLLGHIVSSYQEQARQQQPRPPARPAPPSDDAERERRARELQRRIDEARQRRRELEEAAPRNAGEKSSPFGPPEVPAVVLVQRRPVPPPPVRAPEPPPVVVPPPPVPVAPIRTVAPLPAAPVGASTRQVVALLRDRNSLAAAWLLKEILDRPVSRRPRQS